MKSKYAWDGSWRQKKLTVAVSNGADEYGKPWPLASLTLVAWSEDFEELKGGLAYALKRAATIVERMKP
jgi:hypothetical protein